MPNGRVPIPGLGAGAAGVARAAGRVAAVPARNALRPLPTVSPPPGTSPETLFGFRRTGERIEPQPTTLPSRPRIGNFLLGVGRGFLNATQGALDVQAEEKQQEEEQAFREKQLTQEKELAKEGLGIERERLRLTEEDLTARRKAAERQELREGFLLRQEVRTEARKIAADLPPDLRGQFVEDFLNVNLGLLNGSITDEQAAERLGQLAGLTGAEGLPEQAKLLYFNRIEELRTTVDDPKSRSQQAYRYALTTAATAAKDEFATARLAKINAGKQSLLFSKQIEALGAEIDDREHQKLKESFTLVADLEKGYLAQTASLLRTAAALDANSTSPDLITALGIGDIDGTSAGLATASSENKVAQKALDRASELLEEVAKLRDSREKIATLLEIPPGVVPVTTGEGEDEVPPPATSVSLFDSPEEVAARATPEAPESVRFPEGETPSPFIAPGGPIPPTSPRGVGLIAEIATADPDRKRQRDALAFVADNVTLLWPDGPNVGQPITTEEGEPLPFEQKFKFLERLLEERGPEAVRNYITNMMTARSAR